MGGTKDIWDNAGKGINTWKQLNKYGPQRSDDKRIQFVAFKSGAGLAAEKVVPGNSDQIVQG